jgi:hypothetical protein
VGPSIKDRNPVSADEDGNASRRSTPNPGAVECNVRRRVHPELDLHAYAASRRIATAEHGQRSLQRRPGNDLDSGCGYDPAAIAICRKQARRYRRNSPHEVQGSPKSGLHGKRGITVVTTTSKRAGSPTFCFISLQGFFRFDVPILYKGDLDVTS